MNDEPFYRVLELRSGFAKEKACIVKNWYALFYISFFHFLGILMISAEVHPILFVIVLVLIIISLV